MTYIEVLFEEAEVSRPEKSLYFLMNNPVCGLQMKKGLYHIINDAAPFFLDKWLTMGRFLVYILLTPFFGFR